MSQPFKYPIGYPQSILNNNSEYLPPLILDRVTKIKNNPLEITFANNISPFIMENMRTAVVNPQPFYVELQVNGNIPINTQVRFKSQVDNFVLTAKIDPTRSGEFITYTGLGTATQNRNMATSMAYELLSMVEFTDNYHIIYTADNRFRIVSNSTGNKFNFDLTELATSIASSNINIVGSFTASNEFVFQSVSYDFRAWFELYIAKGAYGDVINKRNSYLVDYSDIRLLNEEEYSLSFNHTLQNYVDYVLPNNPYAGSISFDSLDFKGDKQVVMPYYIAYGNMLKTNSNAEYKRYPSGVSKILFVSKGGTINPLSEYDYSKYIQNMASMYSFSFLTNKPTKKLISKNAIEYLYFYKQASSVQGSLGVNISYRLNDGTYYYNQYTIPTPPVQLKGVLGVEVSPRTVDIQGVESITGKLVKEYTVRIVWVNNPAIPTEYFSQPATYELLQNCYINTTNIIFGNQFGVWDSVEFEGDFRYSVERSSEEYTKPIGISRPLFGFNSKSDSVRKEYNYNVDEVYTYSTNIISKEHLIWLRELLNSSTIYRWSVEQNAYLAILIDSYDLQFNDTLKTGVLILNIKNTALLNTIL